MSEEDFIALPDMIGAHAALQPGKIALTQDGRSIDYATLET